MAVQTLQAKINRSGVVVQNSSGVLSANQLSYESEIWPYTVPQIRVLEIPNKFIGLKLMTRDSFSFTASGTTQAITLNFPVAQDPELNTSSGTIGIGTNIVVFFLTGTTGPSTNFTFTGPKTVTLNGLTSTTAYTGYIYYMFADAKSQAKITITSSDGTATGTLINRAIGNLNTTIQNDVRSGIKPGGLGYILPERFQLQLKVITPAPIFLYAPGSETTFSSPNAVNSFIELNCQLSALSSWPPGTGAYAKQQLTGI